MRVLRRSPVRIAAVLLAVLLIVMAGWYVRSTRHAIAQLQRQRDASCTAFASVGRAPLTATSSALAREIVSTHADAARKLGCEK